MAEGNIEVTVTWAPADSVRMLLERAASMLTGYGELIRRDGASHVEEHHYLPEVEHVAAELRALMDATPRTCGQLGMAVVDAIADDGCRNAAGGIYATRVQEFAREVQRAFAQENGLEVPGLTICRSDGRCQYAIDHGAEGMGHCPKGKCSMPDHGGPVA